MGLPLLYNLNLWCCANLYSFCWDAIFFMFHYLGWGQAAMRTFTWSAYHVKLLHRSGNQQQCIGFQSTAPYLAFSVSITIMHIEVRKITTGWNCGFIGFTLNKLWPELSESYIVRLKWVTTGHSYVWFYPDAKLNRITVCTSFILKYHLKKQEWQTKNGKLRRKNCRLNICS